MPARKRPDARREFGQLERLDEVVVGAGIEAGDAIGDGVARGQHQHRPGVAAEAHRGEDVEAFLARQAQIEQQQLVHVLGERELGGVTVADPVDREAVLDQAASDGLADHRVVLGEQEPHRAGCRSSRAQALGLNRSAAEFMQ